MLIIHASCVAFGVQGVLLLGKSGSGKSDMVLRLMDRSARLVADDQVLLSVKRKRLIATSLSVGQGLMEIRGVGIIKCSSKKSTPLVMAVVLDSSPERLPIPEYKEYLGIKIPVLYIAPFEASAPIKIEFALKALQNKSLQVGAFKK